MEIDHALRNREAEAEPAVFARDDAPALLEGVEDSRHQFRIDPDAVVGDLDHDLMGLVVAAWRYRAARLRA